jgi:hypothetical protein
VRAELRLWRARRRHDRIDAVLSKSASGWQLDFVRNERVIYSRRYDAEQPARDDAGVRLRELMRAGWIDHW